MVRTPCCDGNKVRRGPWSPEEDAALRNYMLENRGNRGSWISLPGRAGLKRCGKSCRLRWMNYLRPDIKRGVFTKEEDEVISALYLSVGSRWSAIASRLPGRTDNDIKNYWNTKLKKKLMAPLARDLSGPKLAITNYDHLKKSAVYSRGSPCQQAENKRLSSFGKDTGVSVSVLAANSDFDSTNNESNLASTFGKEEESFLDFGGSAFFCDFGYLDLM